MSNRNKALRTFLYPSILYPKISLASIILLGLLNMIIDQHTYWYLYYRISEAGFLLAGVLLHFTLIWVYKGQIQLYEITRKKLKRKNGELEAWYKGETASTFGNWVAYALGLSLAIIAVVIFIANDLPWSGFDRFVFLAYLSLFFVLTGMVGYVYLQVLLFLFKMNKLEIISNDLVFFDSEASTISSIYFTHWSMGALLYGLTIVLLWLSPGARFLFESSESAPQLEQMFLLIKIWVFLMAGLVLLFFIAPQYAIHQQLLRFRDRNLDELSEQLNKAYMAWASNPNSELAENVTRITQWREYIAKQPVWTVGIKTFAILVTTILLPLVPTLLQLLLSA